MATMQRKDHLSGAKRDFHHPYTPYEIQETFMNTVYDVLERGGGGVGILESPTGTGKSLSLICASLTWLREHKRKQFDEGMQWEEGVSDEPDWIVEQARARRRRDLLRQREAMEARLAKIRAKEKAQRTQPLRAGTASKKRRLEEEQAADDMDEDQFVLDDYESDLDVAKRPATENSTGLSVETLALMEKAGTNFFKKPEEDEVVEEEEIKIFYCSRTHSQLTQFTNELRRVTMPAALPPLHESMEPDTNGAGGEFKHLTLGSRKNLCINPKVSKLRSMTAINERCVELQQGTTAAEKKCEFLPTKDKASLVTSFRDHTLATIKDIEDLGVLGKHLGICPYYASREVIKPSEIITLPYPLLLQKSAREALGISLKGQVVIVDEAHNLMDAIAGIYGVTLSLQHLKSARKGLGVYLQRFRNRLNGKNRVYLAQLVRLVDSLSSYLEGKALGKQAEGIVEIAELLAGKGVDQIDMHKLLRYLQESKLARKVESYILHTELQERNKAARKLDANSMSAPPPTNSLEDATAPALQHIASLMIALTDPSKEGRMIFSSTPSADGAFTEVLLRYMLLDPTHHFKLIVSEARAVILAGGTMSPMEDYTTHLLSYLSAEQITTLSCGHVIPKDNLMAWALSKGPTGKDFQFTFGKRAGVEGDEMLDELGRALLNLVAVIPDGVVVFFPSYKYLETAIERWRLDAPNGTSLWTRMSTRKSVFCESKEKTGADDVLAEYAKAIDGGQGAMLLSVVGGKMSEGINFSDKLGRCVIVVGLPFPNIMSGEWKAKLAYIESATKERLAAKGVRAGESIEAAKREAQEFYENACMRAVNQSVGRAIRHREDFAVIIMIDARFGKQRIKSKLPAWIQEGLVQNSDLKTFGELMGSTSNFFRAKINT